MAEKQEKAPQAQQVEKKKPYQEEEKNEVLVRIFGYDIPASKNIFSGLTRIKGVSWAISNHLCLSLKYPRTMKISELSKADIAKIESALKNITVPDYMKNRRNDLETGATGHFYGTDLEMKKDFDIKRLKKIKCYKGIRHATGQPVRGQRTRSHFRAKGRATGIKGKTKVKAE